jgi:hypothetical protein
MSWDWLRAFVTSRILVAPTQNSHSTCAQRRQFRPAMLRYVQRPDAVLGTALFAFALTVGVVYCRAFDASKAPPEPWARELGAAVAFACGHGFVDPGYEPSPAVAAFLDKKIERISCEDLPSGVAMRPPNFTQVLYRYMELAVAMTWRLFGVSWGSLVALLGLLHALTALAVFGLFRLATTRAPALAATALLTVSPLQLRYLPQLRDYAKAPFLLALILFLALLVVRPFSRRRLIALAVCYGAVAGIGFGFRNDLLIAGLPFVITVLAFLPVPLRAQAWTKIAGLALCALTFVVCAWPILSAYRSGSNSGHVALLGLMTPFNRPLGVTGSVYDWGQHYDDGYAVKVISSFTERLHHRPVFALSGEYDKAMVEYLRSIVRHWPADVLIRWYASVLRIVELPFQIRLYTSAAPPAVGDGAIGRLYDVWISILSRLSGAGAPVSALAIVMIASSSLRIATWLLLSLVYFGGYPAVQFDPRHFFFLECLPWLALVSLCVSAWRVLTRARHWRSGEPLVTDVHVRARRALAFAAGATLLIGGSLVVMRAYQQRHLTALLKSYVETPTETLTLSATPAVDGRVLLRPIELRQSTESGVRAEYLVTDITRDHCPPPMVPITFRYVTLTGYTDLSQQYDVPVPGSDAPFRLFVPIYYSSGGYFAGLEVPVADRGCVAALRRVTQIDRTPMLINLRLPPDWRDMKLYQTLTPRRPYVWRS